LRKGLEWAPLRLRRPKPLKRSPFQPVRERLLRVSPSLRPVKLTVSLMN
jgi:hypothetical protein